MYYTEKQLRILEFIDDYQSERRISPTMSEIAAKFGVTKITIYEHLKKLERKGALKRERFKKRSIELLVRVDRPQGARLVVPITGVIQQGAALENGQPREELDLSALLCMGKKPRFALLVQGNSMMDDQIRHGDYVIVEERQSATNGDTVLAILSDGRAILRRFYREKSRIRLQPANERMKPTYAQEVEIRGVVIGLLRNFVQAEKN
jgi:repressor LexA